MEGEDTYTGVKRHFAESTELAWNENEDWKFLDYILANYPYEESCCKIDFKYEDGVQNFVNDCTNFSHSSGKFAQTVDNWFLPNLDKPNKKDLLQTGKLAILSAHKFRNGGFNSLCKIMASRLTSTMGNCNTTSKRMVILYLMHLIMTMETDNPNLRTKLSFCREFQAILVDERGDIFRKIVKMACTQQKRELYSLRCRWKFFFSTEALQYIDRYNFWNLEAQKPVTFEHSAEMLPSLVLLSQREAINRKREQQSNERRAQRALQIELQIELQRSEELAKMELLAKKEALYLFHKERREYWKKLFVMDNKFIQMCTKKYDRCISVYDCFSRTVCKCFPTYDLKKYINIVKEAFYLSTNYASGCDTVIMILLDALMRGLPMRRPGVRVVSQIMAFTIIHIIISIEITAPKIVPKARQRVFLSFFRKLREPVDQIVKPVFKNVLKRKLTKKLQFLTDGIWLGNATKHDRICDPYFEMEQIYINDILKYIKKKVVGNEHRFEKVIRTEQPIKNITAKEQNISVDTSKESEEDRNARILVKLKEEAVMLKRKKKEELRIKKAKGVETLFLPDAILSVNAPPKRRISEEIEEKSIKKGNNDPFNSIRSSCIVNSELLDINGQPWLRRGSKCERAMRELRKMLRERNGGNNSIGIQVQSGSPKQIGRGIEGKINRDPSSDETDEEVTNRVQMAKFKQIRERKRKNVITDSSSDDGDPEGQISKPKDMHNTDGKKINDKTVIESHPNKSVQIIDNFQSDDLLENLLNPTFEDFQIVYENGIAQVKFIYKSESS